MIQSADDICFNLKGTRRVRGCERGRLVRNSAAGASDVVAESRVANADETVRAPSFQGPSAHHPQFTL